MLLPLTLSILLGLLIYSALPHRPLWALYLSIAVGCALAGGCLILMMEQLNSGALRWLISNEPATVSGAGDTSYTVTTINPRPMLAGALSFAGLSLVFFLCTRTGWRPQRFDFALCYMFIAVTLAAPYIVNWTWHASIPQRYIDYPDVMARLTWLSVILTSAQSALLFTAVVRAGRGAWRARRHT